MFHGQGIHCDAEGNVYEGEWEHDQRVGIAHWRNAKGDQYIGEFIHNSLTGKVLRYNIYIYIYYIILGSNEIRIRGSILRESTIWFTKWIWTTDVDK